MQRHSVLNRFFYPLIALYICGNCFAVTHRAPVSNTTRNNVTATKQNVSNRTARSATPSNSTAPKTVNRGRAATVSSTKPVVAARAGVKQNVVGNGTKITSATKSNLVSESCTEKYNGCIDSFCMIENEVGGRCNCDNKIFELDKILAEIEEIDLQSYRLATTGVETIETGVDIASVTTQPKKKDNNVLDLWKDKTNSENRGTKRFASAHELCVKEIPECEPEIKMLRLTYSQQIKANCVAYENSIIQKKKQSNQKLNEANAMLRQAALTEIKKSNKYDLGQCTIEFKKCMQTTGGCGDDFSSCAIMSAMDSTSTTKSTSKSTKNYQIKGAITNIEISASTYDNLMAKKPLCESITKSCVNVADKVWDTFLKDAAPQLKNAEIIAEDKARQDCVGNISNCFQKACKDNIDPNDPDGSYDMCLTRPETMLNVCKVPLNACGIDASSREKAEESNIWDYVLAQLASMRVNACTDDVRNCLQSDDRCGKDYTQCIGLDTNTIIRMCPYDKLTGCQKIYGETNVKDDAVYDELFNMVQGIMVNIDNNFLTECQNALTEATIRVCGDINDCTSKTTNKHIGAQTLSYKICPYVFVGDDMVISNENCFNNQSEIPDEHLGRVKGSKTGKMGSVTPLVGKLDGIIYWSSVNTNNQGKFSTIDEYIANAQLEKVMTQSDKERVKAELDTLQQNVDSVIAAIEADPTVQFCITGREVHGMKDIKKMAGVARFPQLTQQTRIMIANSALAVARNNYNKKYDEFSSRLMTDYAKIAARQAEIRDENKKDAYREAARYSCVTLAEVSALPRSPTPPGGVLGKVIIGVIVVAAIVVASVFTFGAAGIAAGAGAAASGLTGSAAAAVGSAAVGAATTAGATVGTVGMAASMTAAGITGVGLGAAAGTVGTAVMGSLATSSLIAGVATGVGAAAAVGGAVATAVEGTWKDKVGSETASTQLTGYHEMNQWNYKEKITSTFDWDNITCEKCVESQHCDKPSVPVFGSTKCKRWGEKTTKCETIKF